jgi:tetratricopeptide (TPR) repeat protein
VPLFATHPDHPGLAHYIIHTCDTPALAQDGLSAARQYASIAPSSPHALHMPGHIFARLGLWDEDIASNLASQTASKRAELAGMPGAGHQMHADEFLIYAWLQIGQDAKAKALTAKMAALGTHIQSMPGMDDMKNDGGFFDNELRAVLGMELRRWKSLAQEKPWPRSRPFETLFLYWGQGVAAGHLKDAGLAAKALRKMDEGIDALRASEFADIEQDALIKRDEVAGWLAYAQGRDDEAVSTLRAAADRQDKHGQMEVDIPAREMLGDLLLLLQRPDEALTEYRVALTLSPNRLNGLINAGRAAEKAGKMDESKAYFHQAADQAHTTVDLIRRRA